MSQLAVAPQSHPMEEVWPIARPMDGALQPHRHTRTVAMTDPLVILAPMRSYSTVVAAMLGQHPQMYSSLETHLFTCDSMRQWWLKYGATNKVLGQGLLRAIAELVMGHQNEVTVELARRWILRRLAWPAKDVFRVLARQVDPFVLIDKSPLIVDREQHLQRVLTAFPRARFLHLTRHPLGFGRSFLKFFEDLGTPVAIDPQNVWLRQHSTILKFLETVSPAHRMRVRGEDLLGDPDRRLVEIAEWIGVETSPAAIDRMKHPERSPFARLGPINAPFGGGDPNFFRDPKLHRSKAKPPSLNGALPWRRDGTGFTSEVRDLAQRFGYA
jgi:Sulfotransferase family